MKKLALIASALLCASIVDAQSADNAPLNETFRIGQKLELNGRTLYIEKIGDKLLLTPPQEPTAKLGAFYHAG